MQVIVVGGGIAGLGAARDLRRAGAEVTVVEKGGEIGGRCRSTRFAGQDVALGAFAFPERDTALTRLADELGLRDDDIVQDLTTGHLLRLFRRDGRTDDVASITPAHLLTIPFVPLRERAAVARLGLLAARMAVTGGYRAPECAAG
ncbi:MAG: FAD-dependent oxidoreductase, partial [Phycicoccus sp.]